MSTVGDINRIIIGLGGTGSRIVDQVYGALIKLGEFQSKMQSSTKFIVIDSDKQSLDNLTYIKQGSKNALPIYLTAPSSTLLKNVNPWMTDELMPAAGQGAGNRRAYGKALYWYHRSHIIQTIGSLIEKMVNTTRTSNFLIILIVGLGGGTGSGTLIDFAIDLRTFIRKNYNTDPFMIGIGILPGPREHNFNKANGYAAVKELHFLMNYGKDIGGKRIYDNPFHSFLLLSRTIKGVDKDQELADAITRFLLDIGFIPYKYREEAKGEKKDLSDLLYRIREYRSAFSTIGYNMISMPIDQVTWLIDAEETSKKVRELINDIDSSIEKIKKDFEVWNNKYQKFVDKVKKYLLTFNEWRKKDVARIKLINRALERGINKLEIINKKIVDVTAKKEELDKSIFEITSLRENLERSLKKLDAEINYVFNDLTSGQQKKTIYRFALSPEEIEKLKESKERLKHMNLSMLFKELGRYDELLHVTIDYIAMGKITLEPLLNYEHIDITSLLERLERNVGSEVLELLVKNGILEYDPDEAKAYNQRWKLGYILSLIITHMSNFSDVDLGKISGFKNFAEKYIAMNAEPLILHSELRRYSFVVYWWISGLKLFSPAPGEQARLRDLEWLRAAYITIKKREGWRGIITHHAFFLGEPNILAEMIGEIMEGFSPVSGREYVVKFWENYEIIDPETVFDRLAITLGSLTVSYRKLNNSIKDITKYVNSMFETALKNLEAQKDISQLGGSLTTIKNKVFEISHNIAKSVNNLKSFKDEFGEVSQWIGRIDKIPYSIKKSLLNLSEELKISSAEFLSMVEESKSVIENIKSHIPPLRIYADAINNVAVKIRLSKVIDELDKYVNDISSKLGEAENIYSEIDSLLSDILSSINRMVESG